MDRSKIDALTLSAILPTVHSQKCVWRFIMYLVYAIQLKSWNCFFVLAWYCNNRWIGARGNSTEAQHFSYPKICLIRLFWTFLDFYFIETILGCRSFQIQYVLFILHFYRWFWLFYFQASPILWNMTNLTQSSIVFRKHSGGLLSPWLQSGKI